MMAGNIRHSELGRWGEDAAATFLQSKGYEIVCRNFRAWMGEIDIIAKKAGVYVFVEVKTRRTTAYGWPEEAVTEEKKEKIYQCAMEFFSERKIEAAHRFDVIAIIGNGVKESEIRHFEGI